MLRAKKRNAVARNHPEAPGRMKSEQTPLVFVYLGATFPSYASHSLKLARETTDNPLIVLAEVAKPRNVADDIDWIVINSFYSGRAFTGFTLPPPYSEEFRDGFWLKTAERFFVLYEFMQWRKLETLFHGELDCMFFDLPRVEKELLEEGLYGLVLPRETVSRCIASLVYVNDPQALESVCTFILQNSHLGNEMEILGAIPSSGEIGVYALPTAEFLYREAMASSWPVIPKAPSFVVDGAVIGRWMFGVDPRNTGGRGTRNRIQNHKHGVPFALPLRTLTLQSKSRKDLQTRVLTAKGRVFDLAVVHVHSKVHKKITVRYVRRLIRRLSIEKSSVIVPMEFIFPLQVSRRVLRQIRITFNSPEALKKGAANLVSVAWWRGLVSRLTNL